ncbi:hypothetical protein BGX27_005839 [Mortierella sp. AM989]|nr:hypothetical protein BGX27_005839 [Mortierella sp. AM989]
MPLLYASAHQSLKKPLVDYLSAYHHHYLSMNLSSTFPILFPNIQRYSPPKSQDLRQLHQVQQQPFVNTTISTFTRNEIERAFLLHRPDLIKTISLPIQRLAAFQSIGSKLSSLVRFELYGISWHFNLDPAIEFVQQHSKLFGTIRELKMAGPNDVKVMQKPKIHGIMKAIKYPKLIDLSRYKEAARDLNSFEIQNVQSLEQLLFDLEFIPKPQSSMPNTIAITPTQTSKTLTAASQSQIQDGTLPVQDDHTLGLIRQCTNLTTLHIGVQSPTGFAWAVDHYNSDPSSLQRFKILHLSSDQTAAVKQVLEDCVYAFRDSLEDLKGVSLKLSPMTPSPSKMEATFGWSRPLNRLSVLSLKGELAVWFDLESLRFCPKLSELHLNLLPYSPPQIEYLEKIAIATQLTVLSLTGRWILTDRVMVKLGEGLQKLKRLDMGGCEYNTAAHPSLTPQGLTSGLDKMKELRRIEADLGLQIETVFRTYRASRPGLEIFLRSDLRSDDGLRAP